nr:MAG TPA: hypothetical protein [Caudoviricetes sp.]
MYDLTRADEPTQEGTPLNKASLLTDAVATAFGLGGSAVPNDVLDILKKGVLAQVTGKYTKHTTIGELPVGAMLPLTVDGVSKDFVVVHQGKPSSIYDDSCDGTWLLMKDIYETRQWHSSDVNKLENSTIHSYLNGDFLGLFDSGIQGIIKQVKIPYRKNGGSGGSDQTGVNGLSCKIFLLSGYELGWTASNSSDLPVDGAKLDYFESGTGTSANNKRIANYGGSATNWWLRSPQPSNTYGAKDVDTNGYPRSHYVSVSHIGIRPAFILPSDYPYTFYTDEDGNVYTEQEYQTILTDVLGNEINAGARVEVGSYVGTGAGGSGNPNTLSFSFSPKFVFVIEGNTAGGSNYWSVFVYGAPYGAGGLYYPSGLTVISQATTWGDKSMSWYIYGAGTTSGSYDVSGSLGYVCQLNNAGHTYYYVAIG